jgi:adenylylsulfate kinase
MKDLSPMDESLGRPIANELCRGRIIWLTGLSGAGKSTLAKALREELRRSGPADVLDGDEVREFLSKGLGFSKEDRDTNVARIGFVARLLARNGVTAIAAAISPYAEARAGVRSLAAREGIPFMEVWVDAPIEVLVARDVKGLYRRALRGELQGFTGISDPYEAPTAPEVHIRSNERDVTSSVAEILSGLARL